MRFKPSPLPIVLFAALLTACSQGRNMTPVASVPGPSEGLPGSATRTSPEFKIYVTNVDNSTMTAYKPDGKQTTPTISTGHNVITSVAVDANGKIYIASYVPFNGPGTTGTVTTYEPDGTQTTPTITVEESGYAYPAAVAVDRNGKIYLLTTDHDGALGTVTTYMPDGSPTTPTITTGADPAGLAVDMNGKIYVANDERRRGHGSVTTYEPDGMPTTPTIGHEIKQPTGVAVDANGTIYVTNTTENGGDGMLAGYVTTYAPDGSGPLQRIKTGIYPVGVAVDSTGKIYVAGSSAYLNIVKTFTPDGIRIRPTISAGISNPSGIALR